MVVLATPRCHAVAVAFPLPAYYLAVVRQSPHGQVIVEEGFTLLVASREQGLEVRLSVNPYLCGVRGASYGRVVVVGLRHAVGVVVCRSPCAAVAPVHLARESRGGQPHGGLADAGASAEGYRRRRGLGVDGDGLRRRRRAVVVRHCERHGVGPCPVWGREGDIGLRRSLQHVVVGICYHPAVGDGVAAGSLLAVQCQLVALAAVEVVGVDCRRGGIEEGDIS